MTPDDKRPKFPRWSGDDLDFWTDMFDQYSLELIRTVSEDAPVSTLEENESRIEQAAQLADKAVQERLYRCFIQVGRVKQRRATRPRTAAKRVRRSR